jgi:hypothetical protein
MNLQIGIEELRTFLREGHVSFEYEKKDGTMRQATGTLKADDIPDEQLPKDKSEEEIKDPNGSNLKYWDLEKDAWRALSANTEVVTLLDQK